MSTRLTVMNCNMWSCLSSSGATLYDENLQQVEKMTGGGISLLRPGQLEVSRVQKHMYTTQWNPATKHEPSWIRLEQLQVALVQDSGCDAAEWVGSHLGVDTINVGSLQELSGTCMLAGVDLCCYWCSTIAASHAAGIVLQMVQMSVRCAVPLVLAGSLGNGGGLWGMAKAVNAEMKGSLRCACMGEQAGAEWSILLASCVCDADIEETQVVWQSANQRQHARLQVAKSCPVGGPVELALHSRGSLSSLSLQQQHGQDPATLWVKAVGLNFRDVLNVLGMYPGDPGAPGGDCAGIACSLNSKYNHIESCSNVLGLGQGSLRSYTTTDERLLAMMPLQWSYEESSSMPTACVTVWAAWEELHAVSSGNVVMVHAATGGVGLLAVQYAQRAGAWTAATAGHPDKQGYLRASSVCMVSSTRDSDRFRTETSVFTGYTGHVNTVLNSLTHDEYVPNSVQLLPQHGCFVEIGKRGIWSRTQMAAETVSYLIIAMDTSSDRDPWWYCGALHRSAEEVQPLPLHTLDLRREGVEAFRVLQRAIHIGKVVVQVEDSMSWTQRAVDSCSNITGGTGGLGLLMAQWLTQQSEPKVSLLSRSGRIVDGAYWEWLARCTAQFSVQVQLCDVSSNREVCNVTEHAGCSLSSIIHSAGVLVDALLMQQTQAGLQHVWTPKAHAGWQMHQMCQGKNELHTFALFSSIAAMLGNVGQANYAAANACLDALAQLRQSKGLAAVSVQWGPWAGAGMAVQSGVIDQLGEQGMCAITPDHGLRALELVARGCTAIVGMVPLHWSVLRSCMGGVLPPFLSSFTAQAVQQQQTQLQQPQHQAGDATGFVSSLHGLEGDAVFQAVENMVLQTVEKAAGVVVNTHSPLMESGVDSLAATELRNSLQTEVGKAMKLPSTLVFDYPTCIEIAQFAVDQLGSIESVATTELSMQPMAYIGEESAVSISVVSMHCIVPTSESCDSSATLWTAMNLAQNSVRRIPAERFDIDAEVSKYQELFYIQHGHFMSGAELFEPKLFGMGDVEVNSTDPSHRVLLEVALATCVQAGHPFGSMVGAAVGMFLGICNTSDYARVLNDQDKVNTYTTHGTDGGAAAGRVSYLFGLKGPCFSVNTACSSSLVALDAGFQNMLLRKCKSALVAGVCLQLHGSSWAGFCALHALSPDGQCKTFDGRANGYGRAEACGAVLLENSDEGGMAKVQGTAVNQDGRSASFMAPNGPSQEVVILLALGGLDWCHLNIEAHGTGTGLGDPIEVGALQRVFQSSKSLCLPVGIGSLKSQIAHSEGAAGAAGLAKTILELGAMCMPPNLHLQTSNPKIDTDGLTTPSQAIALHRATHSSLVGVSSFGYSGTNSHATLSCLAQDDCSPRPKMQYAHRMFSWSCTISVAAGTQDVPLLGMCVPSDDNTTQVWEKHWSQSVCKYMVGHRVGQTPLAPGTGFIQMARVAMSMAGQEVELTQVQFSAILFLDLISEEMTPLLQLKVRGEAPKQISVASSTMHSEWTTHVEMAGFNTTVAESSREIAPLSSGSEVQLLDGDSFYAEIGNKYQNGFRTVNTVWLVLDAESSMQTPATIFTHVMLGHAVAPQVTACRAL
jgi:3-oxoacyl-(acyl-carrier-protein) synthase/NADPH:quinone reductase-like Zn-dependent oxidoreductase